MDGPREPIRLVLEIDRGVEPLAGRIAGGQGGEHSFVGWTGLAAVLSLVLEESGGSESSAGPG